MIPKIDLCFSYSFIIIKRFDSSFEEYQNPYRVSHTYLLAWIPPRRLTIHGGMSMGGVERKRPIYLSAEICVTVRDEFASQYILGCSQIVIPGTLFQDLKFPHSSSL